MLEIKSQHLTWVGPIWSYYLVWNDKYIIILL